MRESEETTAKRATEGDPVDREAGEATSRSGPERGARVRRIAAAGVVALLCVAGWVAGNAATAGPYTVIAWNDLGMHCVDGTDFSVFSLLPPYNNIHAQLTRKDGVDVDPASVRVTYEAIP